MNNVEQKQNNQIIIPKSRRIKDKSNIKNQLSQIKKGIVLANDIQQINQTRNQASSLSYQYQNEYGDNIDSVYNINKQQVHQSQRNPNVGVDNGQKQLIQHILKKKHLFSNSQRSHSISEIVKSEQNQNQISHQNTIAQSTSTTNIAPDQDPLISQQNPLDQLININPQLLQNKGYESIKQHYYNSNNDLMPMIKSLTINNSQLSGHYIQSNTNIQNSLISHKKSHSLKLSQNRLNINKLIAGMEETMILREKLKNLISDEQVKANKLTMRKYNQQINIGSNGESTIVINQKTGSNNWSNKQGGNHKWNLIIAQNMIRSKVKNGKIKRLLESNGHRLVLPKLLNTSLSQQKEPQQNKENKESEIESYSPYQNQTNDKFNKSVMRKNDKYNNNMIGTIYNDQSQNMNNHSQRTQNSSQLSQFSQTLNFIKSVRIKNKQGANPLNKSQDNIFQNQLLSNQQTVDNNHNQSVNEYENIQNTIPSQNKKDKTLDYRNLRNESISSSVNSEHLKHLFKQTQGYKSPYKRSKLSQLLITKPMQILNSRHDSMQYLNNPSYPQNHNNMDLSHDLYHDDRYNNSQQQFNKHKNTFGSINIKKSRVYEPNLISLTAHLHSQDSFSVSKKEQSTQKHENYILRNSRIIKSISGRLSEELIQVNMQKQHLKNMIDNEQWQEFENSGWINQNNQNNLFETSYINQPLDNLEF
eukprot:403362347